ncbi:MAG TPA: hypothetical protein PK048_00685 [Candidatus Absconditabacterales bacterium]|nr:hypothetical protein [Candidatus Absconditabacterales bacterium]
MFDNTLLIFLKYIIIIKGGLLLIGIPRMVALFGNTFRGFKLWILARFFGILVLSSFLFIIQFLYHTLGWTPYVICAGIGFISCIRRIKRDNISFLPLLQLNEGKTIKRSFDTKYEKIIGIVGGILTMIFILLTGIHHASFPNYGDDAFGNRQHPATNIYYDNGITMIGNTEEILGRGRLGYPIHIPLFNAQLHDMAGSRNHLYTDFWQRIGYIGVLLLSFLFVYQRTGKLFNALLGPICMSALPLVYFHVIDGYMELPSIYFTIIACMLFVDYLETKQRSYLLLSLLFVMFLPNIKNDGLIVYATGVIIAMIITLGWKECRKEYQHNLIRKNVLQVFIGGIFIFIPFALIKIIYGLGYNQAQGANSGIGISSTFHPEIFSIIPGLFYKFGNFGLIGLLFIWIIYNIGKSSKNSLSTYGGRGRGFILLTCLILFIIINIVFYMTDNYQFVMNQTTVNRIYTNIFMILCCFIGLRYSSNISNQNK